jgi:hypothetical protein
MKNKRIFLIDLTNRPKITQAEFEKSILYYPNRSVCIVTPEQKIKILGFSGNAIRFVRGENTELKINDEVMVYDGVEASVYIVTGRNLDK